MKTLKNIATICIALFALVGLSQNQSNLTKVSTEQAITNLKIEVKVESLKELEDSFNIEDLKKVFLEINTKDDIEFKITCRKPSNYGKGFIKEISYKIVGCLDEREAFLKLAERTYNSAKKYYID